MADETDLEDLRFPIGRLELKTPSSAECRCAIDSIAALPAKIREAVAGLTEEQLATQYRPEGWNLRQVVHHLADSHINSWCRFRLALTEDVPTIQGYDEKSWAKLPDADGAPIELSLALLDTLHARWVVLLRALSPEQLKRTFYHAEMKAEIPLDTNLLLYAWHGEHHTAHVTSLRLRNRWD